MGCQVLRQPSRLSRSVDTGTWVMIFPVNAQRPKFVLGEVTVSSRWTATLPSDRLPSGKTPVPRTLACWPSRCARGTGPSRVPSARSTQPFQTVLCNPKPSSPPPALPSSAHDLASCRPGPGSFPPSPTSCCLPLLQWVAGLPLSGCLSGSPWAFPGCLFSHILPVPLSGILPISVSFLNFSWKHHYRQPSTVGDSLMSVHSPDINTPV